MNNRTDALELGISDNPLIKDEVKAYLDRKTHSAAYIRLCGMEAKRLGKMELAVALNELAVSKTENEAMLMEAFGVKEDLRLNLSNVIIRATEDVAFASKIADLAKKKNECEAYAMLYQLAIKESENLEALKGILSKMNE